MKKLETSFFLNRIYFSTRKCMFPTFSKNLPQDYTAALTNGYRLEILDFENRGIFFFLYCVAKTKALISFAVTAKLICAFVYAQAKIGFSHDAAHIEMVK